MGTKGEEFMPSQPWGATLRPVLCLFLAFLLGLPQGIAPAAEQTQPAPAKLNILIVGGEGAINNVRQRTAREPIVQVEDENHRPVAGAAVLFMLPDSGPSGVFTGGGRTLAVKTDSAGRAVAKGLRANKLQGKFQIQVQASYQGVTGSATITQVNAVLTAGAAAGGISAKMIAILAAVGGAAAVGAVVATRKGSTPQSPSQPPTTVSAGTPTVGGPR
jgi:hypothetical protein